MDYNKFEIKKKGIIMARCLAPLIFSTFYLLVYALALIILLIVNSFRFTKQIKVVLTVLFIALTIQFTSCYLVYQNGNKDDTVFCVPTDLSDTLYKANESFTEVLYMFLIYRMLYIYAQLIVKNPKKTCA